MENGDAFGFSSSARIGSSSIWRNNARSMQAFSRSAREEDDEEDLKWAAMRLPTYRHLFDAFKLIQMLCNTNHRVGLDMPTIEVRFKHLNVEAEAYVGNRALPTIFNFTANVLEGLLSYLHILPSRKKTLPILNDINGIIRPRRASKLREDHITIGIGRKARVTYNGHGMKEFVPERTSAYISQYDVHIGEMTVRETLAFSARCQGVGPRYEMLKELSRREKEANIKPDPDIDIYMKAAALEGQEANVVTDYILKILGLEVCADTMVGDEMRRGISGGQRKRVTTGEMLVGPARALFMDEISTGLDSSTTFQIVNSLRQSVHILNGTALISLLQPAPETYDLIDDIILLSDGQIVYQGPRENVTSRKDQEQYWARKDEPYSFISVKELTEAFQSFHIGQKIGDDLAVPFDKSKSHPAALTKEKYGVSKKELLKACVSREYLLMKRNLFVYVFETFQLIFVGLITMTTFLRTEMHRDTIADGGIFMGALFFILLLIMYNAIAELTLTILKLPVFYKQRDLLFFPSWAYSLPAWILKTPLNLLKVTIWACVSYFVIGFNPSVGSFFKVYLILLCLIEMASGLFRLMGGLGRKIIVANTCGAFAMLLVLVMGGFILSRDDVKRRLKWAYWISPLMYAQNAITVNEFLGKSWRHVLPNSTEPLGVLVLKARGIFPQPHWYWIGVGALIGYGFLLNFLFTLALKYLDPFGKPQAVISKETLAEKIASKTGQNIELSPRGRGSSESVNGSRINASVKSLSAKVESFNEDNHKRKRGMVLPFEPLSMSFDEIKYAVDRPQEMIGQGISVERLQLLKGVSGAFRPRVLTALMGVSGAGKTTLMDVLAGRKTGGYVEGTSMNPWFSLHGLDYPREVNSETRKMFIEEVMELVELTPLKKALVGLPGVNGLSTEQRKRLTIAVELVANPSIIFMDEPTSGLDARAAAIVMRTVRNTVDTGRTVVCTIHQPSIDIFDAFDELLLLKRGGEEIYVSPLGLHSCHLIKYFEEINGIPKIKDGYNPATWMLEVTSEAHEEALGVNFTSIYKNSELYRSNKALVKDLSNPAPGSKDLYFQTRYSQSMFTQCIACLWKQYWSYWRNPPYTDGREIFFTTFIALLFGAIFWDLGSKRTRRQDVLNSMGSMYAAVFFIGCQNALSVQPVVAVERTVFYRERQAGMYSALPYAFGQAVIELPYILVQTVIYGVIVYAMIGFEWTAPKFFWYLFFMYFTFLYFTFFGMMTVAITPDHNIAGIISSAFFTIWNLFSGFIVPRTRIPVWWRWYYWFCPISWSLYGLIASQYGDMKTHSTPAKRLSPPLLLASLSLSLFLILYYSSSSSHRLQEKETLVVERMPMKVVDATVSTFGTIFEKFKADAPNNKANFILFLADKDPSTSLSWCPDCVRAEPVIYKKLEATAGDVALLRAYVGDRPTWRNPQHPWRVDSTFKLTGVPTLILWDSKNHAVAARLEDHEAHIEHKIEALLSSI
ncbi:hypothetical protein V6N12_064251 [Hibiscus sabdariffa]|uniref:ABC transporter domain-containing protein n=1 Tax=Hibiscus sabdariffa TaxID=183260 RepID=A0ABR2G5A9_9ROSI